MQRLAFVLAALLALPADAGWQKVSSGWVKLSDGGGFSTPATCTTAGQVPIFLGSPLALGCDAGLTYDSASDTLTTTVVQLPNTGATRGAPSLMFGTAFGVGLRGNNGTGQLFMTSGGTDHIEIAADRLLLGGTVKLCWEDGGAGYLFSGTPDVCLVRAAPGVIKATNGSTGDGTIQMVRVATGGLTGSYSKILTLGSNTDFFRVNFPASSTVTVTIDGSVAVSDSAAPVQRKAHGGKYSVSAYRLATGDAVAGAVTTEYDVSNVYSAGDALTQAITVTPDADGIIIGTNVTVGSGLTAPNTGVLNYTANVNGTGGVAIVPSAL